MKLIFTNCIIKLKRLIIPLARTEQEASKLLFRSYTLISTVLIKK